ncbi:VOC family protein [Mucilaginibacter sp. P19]|uniref:VOC family protein n=1 Tax=Mucilaginibacter sp. P19 TaxID=3423947 RepID=UPI003D67F8FA
MLKLNRVHHIAIICSDYAKSKRFYTEVLGLKIVREVYREQRQSYKLDLEVGDLYQIELFSFPIRLHVLRVLKRQVYVI